MTRPQKTYQITFSDAQTLSNIVGEFDALKCGLPAKDHEWARRLVNAGHDILVRTLGDEAALIYGENDGNTLRDEGEGKPVPSPTPCNTDRP